jgi:hypothetical protein
MEMRTDYASVSCWGAVVERRDLIGRNSRAAEHCPSDNKRDDKNFHVACLSVQFRVAGGQRQYLDEEEKNNLQRRHRTLLVAAPTRRDLRCHQATKQQIGEIIYEDAHRSRVIIGTEKSAPRRAEMTRMQQENWKAIESSQAVSLEDADRALLDKVQTRLALSDGEFRHFLVLIGKVAPNAARLAAVRFLKP